MSRPGRSARHPKQPLWFQLDKATHQFYVGNDATTLSKDLRGFSPAKEPVQSRTWSFRPDTLLPDMTTPPLSSAGLNAGRHPDNRILDTLEPFQRKILTWKKVIDTHGLSP